jgi:hypothetical protein
LHPNKQSQTLQDVGTRQELLDGKPQEQLRIDQNGETVPTGSRFWFGTSKH